MKGKSGKGPRHPDNNFELRSPKKTPKFMGLTKTTWRKIAVVAISMYIGWSWAKINDQNQIIDLQRKVLAAEADAAPNPSALMQEGVHGL